MILANKLIECGWPHPIGKGLRRFSPCWRVISKKIHRLYASIV